MSKVILIILDGFGEGKDYEGNAITHAETPTLNHLLATFPHSLLKSHGNAVGLPEGTQGGSEVGHFTIGAGRIVYQTLEEINRSIKKGDFFQKKELLEACNIAKKRPKAALHLIGMISDQGVHSDINHLYALLELAKKQNVEKVFIHAITDGRDVPEKSAELFLHTLQEKIEEIGIDAKIATMIGRYYAMDRDNNWGRTEKAYSLMINGGGKKEKDPIEAMHNAYARGIETDYYLDPILLDEHGIIKEKDAVIFWNFRTDRTRQLTCCFTREKEIGFTPQENIAPYFVCMGDFSEKAPVVFPTPIVKNNFGSIVAKHGLHQLRIAETEKYAHVTYFFNSQVHEPNAGEDRILIDSKKVASYREKPEMSAREITERLLKEIDSQKYEVIIANFANCDLVGHSGDLPASIQAVEIIDECMNRITKKVQEKKYITLITGDHGNVEYMIYDDGPEKGQPCPSHTRNPVPLIVVSDDLKNATLSNGELKDIAPTMLSLLKIEKPKEMTGRNLITHMS